MTGTANIASCTLGNSSSALNVQRLLPLALIDMAKHNSQSSEQSKSSSRFNIFKRPISPTSSEQNQGWSLKLPKLFRKSQSTTPTQSTSSLPLVCSTVDSNGETALGEHAIISPFVLLSKLNVESSIATTPSGMRRIITSQIAHSPQP
jgi:hypothetical protein